MTLNEISKFMSLILRHKSKEIGISLDEHGWHVNSGPGMPGIGPACLAIAPLANNEYK